MIKKQLLWMKEKLPHLFSLGPVKIEDEKLLFFGVHFYSFKENQLPTKLFKLPGLVQVLWHSE